MRLWDRLRQKDRVADLRLGLWRAMLDAGATPSPWQSWPDDQLVAAARETVVAAVEAVDGVLSTGLAALGSGMRFTLAENDTQHIELMKVRLKDFADDVGYWRLTPESVPQV